MFWFKIYSESDISSTDNISAKGKFDILNLSPKER